MPAALPLHCHCQSAPLTTDPLTVGDPYQAHSRRRTDRRCGPAVPWAKAVAAFALTTFHVACTVGFAIPPGYANMPPGFADMPPAKPTMKNLVGITPGGSLPDPFRVGSGAAGYDLQTPNETPVTEVVPLKSPGVTMTSATPRQLRNNIFQKIFTPESKDYVSYLAGAALAAAMLAVTLHMMAGAAGAQAAQAPRDFNYRVPPSWTPENDSSYSFRAFIIGRH